jgi:hypothetical protein
MRNTYKNLIGCTFAVLLLAGSTNLAATPLGSAFTYAGSLQFDGTRVNGTADLRCTLWDAAAGGSMIGSVVLEPNIPVEDGLLAVELDFGVLAFNGDARWLEIEVRTPHDPTDTAPFATLSPRQPLSAVPYALQTRGIFVDDSLNVGIGTTTPATDLHIADDHVDVILERSDDSKETLIQFKDTADPGTHWYVGMDNVPSAGANGFSIKETQNTTPAIFVESGSKFVGIGTATPASPLHIEGDPTTADLLIAPDQPADGNSGTTASLTLAEDDDATFHMRLEYDGLDNAMHVIGESNGSVFGPHMTIERDTGNVGIGTATPTTELHVVADTANAFVRVEAPAGQQAGHFMESGSNIAELFLNDNDLLVNNKAAGGDLGLATENTRRLTIDSVGNVGIGTTAPSHNLTVEGNARFSGDVGIGRSPQTRLHVKDDTANAFVTVEAPDGLRAGHIMENGSNLALLELDDNLLLVRNQSSLGDIGLVTGNTRRLTVDSAGNVGIGTSSPSVELEVNGALLANSHSGIGKTYSDTAFTIKPTDFTDDYSLFVEGFQGNNILMVRNNFPGGRVGINQEFSNVALNVRGSTYQATNNIIFNCEDPSGTSRFMVLNDGDIIGCGIACISDIRWKKDVRSLENALEKVSRLRGVSFQWREEKNMAPGSNIGFVAQEIEAVVPEVVKTDSDGFKAVSYGSVTPLLVEAVKELKDEHGSAIAALRSENTRLRSQNERLEARLARLEGLVVGLERGM